jgi:hypothetical protein
MQKKNAEEILKNYKEGKATDDEINQLLSWMLELGSEENQPDFSEAQLEAIQKQIWNNLPLNDKKVSWLKSLPRIAVAASVLLLLSIGAYFVRHHQPPQQIAQNQPHDIAPGSNKAILTLANGQKIVLADIKNGTIVNQGATTIAKTVDDEIIYNSTSSQKEEELAKNSSPSGKTENEALNTITTPRGGQYQVILPDGSHVWLNSASSIKFPVAFTGNSREVTITGEAYFEVARNKAKPFRVISNFQTVEVLGTHFNINAYADESLVKTTLLEGSVRITQLQPRATAILEPGQQATTSNQAAIQIIKDFDTEEITAWKNGYFMFNHEPIESIMRKVARWYDVDVIYQQVLKNDWFNGSVSRYKNISEVLHKLELTGQIHFKIEGRRIIVMP